MIIPFVLQNPSYSPSRFVCIAKSATSQISHYTFTHYPFAIPAKSTTGPIPVIPSTSTNLLPCPTLSSFRVRLCIDHSTPCAAQAKTPHETVAHCNLSSMSGKRITAAEFDTESVVEERASTVVKMVDVASRRVESW